MFLYILTAAAADFALYGVGRLWDFSHLLSDLDGFGCILAFLLTFTGWLIPHTFADGNAEGNRSYRFAGIMLLLLEKAALAFLYIRWADGARAAEVVCLTAVLLGFLYDISRISFAPGQREQAEAGNENGTIARQAH